MKIRRLLPPVGYRLPLGELMSSAARSVIEPGYRESILEPEIARHFVVRHVRAVSSGKAALALILLALRRLSSRTKVIIPAYTCYSVPSAIVKAGLQVVPCDVAEGSFDYDYEQLIPLLQSDVLCVLSVHLLGIPSNTRRLNDLCRDAGILVIEDAAQSLGGMSDGRLLGTQADAGFFSLGRGKNVTCGSGGIAVTNSDDIAAAISACTTELAPAAATQNVSTFVTMLLLRWFISPRLYWFPAGLPFLKLGETIFHEQFSMGEMSAFQALLLRGWRDRLAELDATRRMNARYYQAQISGATSFTADVPYLRFPILLPGSTNKDRLLVEQDGIALGISGLYPASVGTIPQLRDHIGGRTFPKAERVAASLVTLPTHPLVSDNDRSRIAALVNLTLAHPSSDSSLSEPVPA